MIGKDTNGIWGQGYLWYLGTRIPLVSGDKDTFGIWGERIDEFFDSKNTIKKLNRLIIKRKDQKPIN